MDRSGRLGSLAAAACAVALATRLPASLSVSLACAALAVATVACAALAGDGTRRWAAPGALAGGGALLLVPSHPDAWLPLPAVAAALPMLLAFHAILRPHTAQVPRLPGAPASRRRRVLALMPWATLAAAAATVPLWGPVLLPDRLGASAELQGPAGPLVAALLVAAACLAYALARRALARPGGDA